MRGLLGLGSLFLSQAQLAPTQFVSYENTASYGTPVAAPYIAPVAAPAYGVQTTVAAGGYGVPLAAGPYGASVVAGPYSAQAYGGPGPYYGGNGGYGRSQDRSFLFRDPALDLVAVSSLSQSKSSLLPLLVLTGGLNGNGNGYDNYGQDPAKKAVLLSGLSSGQVSPLTAIALDRNPGATPSDALVVSALGNNPLTSLLVLNQNRGESFTGGNNFFGGNRGGYYDNGYNNGYNGGLFGGNGGLFGGNGVLPALILSNAIGGGTSNGIFGGNGGLGTLLLLNELDDNNNNGYYNGYNNGYNGNFYGNGRRRFRGIANNVRNNLDDLFDGY